LRSAPDAPLPFERHRVFGVNLSGMSSLQALDWLNAAGNPNFALVVAPIDADVVSALAQGDNREAALTAVETMRQAAGGSPLAVCLRRPSDIVGGLSIAQAAVGAISSRIPDQVVYVSACDGEHPGWQANIVEAARPDLETGGTRQALIPFSAGAIVDLQPLDEIDDLEDERLMTAAADRYVLYSAPVFEPLGVERVESIAETLSDASQAGLVLLEPAPESDAAALAASIANVTLASGILPEGFASVAGPGVTQNESWRQASVGTIRYLRASGAGAALAAEFIGTDIFLVGLQSPESGVVQVWIDPASSTARPTVELDLESVQARDVAIPIARGLPAARHRIVIQAVADDGRSVTLSGLFVTGKPATAWTGAMAATALLAVAIAALTERSYAAVVAIRRRAAPPRRRIRSGHPRVFARDR
jgi:hypothetical protein